jgi:hypothetical protein
MYFVDINDIPNEILTSTFGFLDVLSLLTCEQVCLLWSAISNQSILWKNLCIRHQRGAVPLIEFKLNSTEKELLHTLYSESSKRRCFGRGVLHMSTSDASLLMKRKGERRPNWKEIFLHFHQHGWFVSRWVGLDKEACLAEVVAALQFLQQEVLHNATLDQALLLWLQRYACN